MNIVSERDGLEMANENGDWKLYLIEDDGSTYTLLASFVDYTTMSLLSEFIASPPKRRAICQDFFSASL